MITLTNTFHNTSVNVKVDEGQPLSLSQTRRASRALCGVADCKCGAFHRDEKYTVDYVTETDGVFIPVFERIGVGR